MLTKGEDYVKELRNFYRENKRPFSAVIELTHRCNFRCKHCYLLQDEEVLHQLHVRKEIGFERWQSILDQAFDAGVLTILLTGGEPTLHPDFSKIYTYTVRKGFRTSVYSNGVFISDFMSLFIEWPPAMIDVSIYGFSEDTYYRFTGVKGAFAKVREAVEKLVSKGINVHLKTVANTYNIKEIPEIKKWAEGLGIRFRFITSVNPTAISGNYSPTRLQVSLKQVVAKLGEIPPHPPVEERFLVLETPNGFKVPWLCDAAVASFLVNPYGEMMPCTQLRVPKYDLAETRLSTAWDNMLRDLLALIKFQPRCYGCELLPYCDYCPAWIVRENSQKFLSTLCKEAALRAQLVEQMKAPKFQIEILTGGAL